MQCRPGFIKAASGTEDTVSGKPSIWSLQIQVYLNEELVLEKKKRSAAPGEMEQILIPEKVLEAAGEIRSIRLQMEEV